MFYIEIAHRMIEAQNVFLTFPRKLRKAAQTSFLKAFHGTNPKLPNDFPTFPLELPYRFSLVIYVTFAEKGDKRKDFPPRRWKVLASSKDFCKQHNDRRRRQMLFSKTNIFLDVSLWVFRKETKVQNQRETCRFHYPKCVYCSSKFYGWIIHSGARNADGSSSALALNRRNFSS